MTSNDLQPPTFQTTFLSQPSQCCGNQVTSSSGLKFGWFFMITVWVRCLKPRCSFAVERNTGAWWGGRRRNSGLLNSLVTVSIWLQNYRPVWILIEVLRNIYFEWALFSTYWVEWLNLAVFFMFEPFWISNLGSLARTICFECQVCCINGSCVSHQLIG